MKASRIPTKLIPTTRSAFRSALHKGLGRAIWAMKRGYPASFDAELLDACMHWRGGSMQQFEGNRATYLCDLIDRSRQADAIRSQVVGAVRELLSSKGRNWTDAQQRCWLACRFAERGDAAARTALRERFARLATIDNHTPGEEAYICLDRVAALRLIASKVPSNSRPWWIVNSAEHHIGKSTLLKAAKADPAIAQLLKQGKLDFSSREDRPHYSYRTIKRMAHELPRDPSGAQLIPFNRWARGASSREAHMAAADLPKLKSASAITAYLQIASRDREFVVFDFELLLRLARHANNGVAKHAQACLTHVRDPRIRACALERIRTRRWNRETLEMLETNYEAGDECIVERYLLRRLTFDQAWSFRSITGMLAHAHTRWATEATLLWGYENVFCGFTRKGIVNKLIRRKLAPRWLLHECLFDSYPETRALAHRTLWRLK